MFICSPFSFMFLFFYLFFLFFLFCISDFFIFWIVMEGLTFLFIGIAYSLFSIRFSRLILFFILQSVSSINILFYYTLALDRLLVVFVFFKLAMFPFSLWYYPVIFSIPNILFFISSTLHKFPSFLVLLYFSFNMPYKLLGLCLIFNILISSIIIYSIRDLRSILIFSSVANNSWFLLATYQSLVILILFIFIYFVNFGLLFSYTPKLRMSTKFPSNRHKLWFFILMLAIRGFPPFPIFFIKLYLISLTISLPIAMFNAVMLYFFLLTVVFMIISYIRYSIALIMWLHSSKFEIYGV